MTVVNTTTGEIVEVSHQERAAVARLTTAITALTEAVDFMPIGEVVTTKAELATIQTATKELGMSQEAQELAAEAVRRAEWALGRAIRAGQGDGSILSDATKGGRSRDVDHPDIARPVTDFATRGELYGSQRATGYFDLADTAPNAPAFDAAIEAARADGGLSRANVARKARELSGKPQQASRRKPLPDFTRDAAYDLRKAVERLERISGDDRLDANKDQVAAHLRSHLNHAIEVCQDLLDRINNN